MKSQKKKKAGSQPVHPGHTRRQPDPIDRREEHRLDCCPHCGGPLQRCHGKKSVRIRIIEDLPEGSTLEVTKHLLHRDYCPSCQKPVEPKVEDALNHSRIGHRLLVLTAYWHYALGLTLVQIRDTLNFHMCFHRSKGGDCRAMASAGPVSAALVRNPDRRDPALGGLARRRDRVAGERGDPLVERSPSISWTATAASRP